MTITNDLSAICLVPWGYNSICVPPRYLLTPSSGLCGQTIVYKVVTDNIRSTGPFWLSVVFAWVTSFSSTSVLIVCAVSESMEMLHNSQDECYSNYQRSSRKIPWLLVKLTVLLADLSLLFPPRVPLLSLSHSYLRFQFPPYHSLKRVHRMIIALGQRYWRSY